MPALDIELRGRQTRVAQVFNDAQNRANAFTQRLTASNAVAGRLVSTLGRLGGVGAGIAAATAAVAALGVVVRNTAREALILQNTSDSLGVSASGLTVLSTAIRSLTAEPIESVNDALRDFNERIGEAVEEPDSGIAQVFRRLNVNLVDAEGNVRSLTDVLPDFVDAFEGLDVSQQTFLLREYGDELERVLGPLVRNTSAFRDATSRARELVVINDELVRSAAEGNAGFTELGAAASSFGTNILNAITSSDLFQARLRTNVAALAALNRLLFGGDGPQTQETQTGRSVEELTEAIAALDAEIRSTNSQREMLETQLEGITTRRGRRGIPALNRQIAVLAARGEDATEELNALQAALDSLTATGTTVETPTSSDPVAQREINEILTARAQIQSRINGILAAIETRQVNGMMLDEQTIAVLQEQLTIERNSLLPAAERSVATAAESLRISREELAVKLRLGEITQAEFDAQLAALDPAQQRLAILDAELERLQQSQRVADVGADQAALQALGLRLAEATTEAERQRLLELIQITAAIQETTAEKERQANIDTIRQDVINALVDAELDLASITGEEAATRREIVASQLESLGATQEEINAILVLLDRLGEAENEIARASSLETLRDGLESAVNQGISAGFDAYIESGDINDFFDEIGQRLLDTLLQAAIDALVSNLFANFLGGSSSAIGRQMGGRVTPGQLYVVGERRPELFVPDQAGTILPSVGAAGGITVNNNITGIVRNDADIRAIAQETSIETTRAAQAMMQRQFRNGRF